MRRFPCLAVLVVATAAAGAARAEDVTSAPTPLFAYTGAFNVVAAGGRSRVGSYVHTAAAGVKLPVSGPWSLTVQGAATAGTDLTTRVLGNVAGVQGPFNAGNGFWLYEVKLSYETEAAKLFVGRLSSGDALPGVSGMDQFVNSAFSSNGGALSVNDAGRGTTPAATWGVTGRRSFAAVELRGGAFLSDPARMTLGKHGLDLSFRPGDGVFGFAEAVAPVGGGLKAGLGAFGDSARFATFDGRTERGNGGAYAWIERPPPDKGPGISGFAMAEAAPGAEKNLQPLFLIAGMTWHGLNGRRPEDSASLGVASGRFSHRSPLHGTETVLEADYRFTLSDHFGVRPDLQYVINPGGRAAARNALVLGVQLEASL